MDGELWELNPASNSVVGMRKGEDNGKPNKRNVNEEATWTSTSSNASKKYNKGIVKHMSHEGTGIGWRTPGLKV